MTLWHRFLSIVVRCWTAKPFPQPIHYTMDALEGPSYCRHPGPVTERIQGVSCRYCLTLLGKVTIRGGE